MSFSNEVKEEIMSQELESDCCCFATLCSYINSLGSLEITKQGVSFSIKTENPALLTNLQDVVNKIYSDKIDELLVTSKTIGKTVLYDFSVPTVVGNRILMDCGILKIGDKNAVEINDGIDHHIIMEDCCKKWYIKTSFLCVGTLSVPSGDNSSKGYHFELEYSSANQAKIIANLLGEFGFIARKVERNGKYVVYMKESEMIADFLAFVGATKSYLKLQNEMITRDMRNSINRQSNCISANIDKTVQASLGQLHAIEIIEATIGIDSLPENLRKYAILRKRNPEASLSELITLSDEKITKSGMNYKLNKIVEISKNL